jgi:hypothetical protein
MRTMLEVVACGAFSDDLAFPVTEVTPDMLKSVRIYDLDIAQYYAELPEPLRAMGRHDLANGVERKLRQWRIREVLLLNRLRPLAKRLVDKLRGTN